MGKDSEKCSHMGFFIKGFLEAYMLSETSNKPTSGKEIMDSISNVTEDEWNPSPGAIYPILRKMETDSLIESKLDSEKGRRKILYVATKKGKVKFRKFKNHFLKHSSEKMKLMLPLIIRITHPSLHERVSAKTMELSKLFVQERTRLMSLPKEDLEPELDKLIFSLKRIQKARESR